VSWGYAVVRRFHNAGEATMVATNSLRRELEARGFTKVGPWTRGVDTNLFNPDEPAELDFPRPIFATVGRVAVEKNLEAFLSLDLPGTKAVIGDGPQLAELTVKYPEAKFLGPKFGDELADAYASADVFVFPSLTDTFGLVILEAMAAGAPVAAYPAPGPIDIIPGSGAGAVNEDLQQACLDCLKLDHKAVRAYAEKFSWRASAEEFVRNLQPYPEREKTRFWRRLRRIARLRGRQGAL
jgi:glycosyltransferase involved in cell wall biosynthesis